MNPRPPNLIVEEGPERGREIIVPADGARLGRATENDIVIADASMSRFQCRIYFRDGFLHIMDLGSTNETLVNDVGITDQALRHGDHILIGETLIRVVNDGLGEVRPEPVAAPAPIRFNLEPAAPTLLPAVEPEPPPAPIPDPSELEAGPVDLGLGRRKQVEEGGPEGERRSALPRILIALATMLVVLAVGFVVLLQDAAPPVAAARNDEGLRILYEKVQSGNGNIFRYAVTLDEKGALVAAIHDLTQQRDIRREEKVGEKDLAQMRNQMLDQRDVFFGLREEYRGVSGASHESYRITLIFGREAKSVLVENQLEPDAFKEVRERVEAFAGNLLGLSTLHMPPEVLRARADEAWANARKLYEERDVKNGNLWDATQRLKEAAWLLETIEPKPDYYRDAVQLRVQWLDELNRRVMNLDFEAVREYQVGNRERAAELYRRIMATIPERANTFHNQAYNNLNRIEQEINR